MATPNYRQIFAHSILWIGLTLQCAVAIISEARLQYIHYNGVLTGQFLGSNSASNNCSGFSFNKMENASMNLGVNPPWDKNSFYWDITNDGSRVSRETGEACYSPGGCTDDSLYNLYFATASYVCFKEEGKKCGYIQFSPFYFEGLQIADVNAAKVMPISEGGLSGYSIVGNPGKFVSNGTVEYSLDLQTSNSYSLKCPTIFGSGRSIRVSWNNTNAFSYALNITNSTMTANITLSAPIGTIFMLFSGNRQADTSGNNQYSSGNHTPISLDTSDAGKPQFTFVNGSHIGFKDIGNNEYRVVVANSARGIAITSWFNLSLTLIVIFCWW